MSCYSCGSGFHIECIQPNDDECCCLGNEDLTPVANDDDEDRDYKKKHKSRGKRDATLRDQQSTGRKRAAKEYPLNREANCEWSGLKNAGGGLYPIVGCLNGKQEARHHGPDKNTLNNDEGNVHRICAKCHNRWHTRNDNGYEWAGNHAQHDSETRATPSEIVDSEFYWIGNKTVIAKD